MRGQLQRSRHVALGEEAHPPHSETLGAGGEPEVLHGRGGRVRGGLRLGVPTQRVAPTASGIAGDHDADRRGLDGLHPQRRERAGPGGRQRCRVTLPRRAGQRRQSRSGRRRADDHEVPRLAEPDARRGVSGREHPAEHVVRDRGGGESGAHVAALGQHPVHAARSHCRPPPAAQLDRSRRCGEATSSARRQCVEEPVGDVAVPHRHAHPGRPQPRERVPAAHRVPAVAQALADLAAAADLEQHEGGAGAPATSTPSNSASAASAVRAVGGDPGGRGLRLARRHRGAARLAAHQRRRGHRPMRLHRGHRLDQRPARRARSRPAARPGPRSWSGCARTTRPGMSRRRPGTPAPPGTASMNASSTTSTRPGRASAAKRRRGVQHGGRVGRVADDHQVGVGRNAGRVEREAVLGAQHHPVHVVAGDPQRHLGFGELRVHDHGAARRARPGRSG